MTEVMNQLNSNQRLIRSHPKSSKSSSQSSAMSTSVAAASVAGPTAVNSFAPNPSLTSRFMTDPQGSSRNFFLFESKNVSSLSFSDPTANFLSSTAYSFVNPELANYAADAFVYSQLSDLNNRADLTTSYPATTRMHPYARQSFYPMYNQREIHSPSRTRSDYS